MVTGKVPQYRSRNEVPLCVCPPGYLSVCVCACLSLAVSLSLSVSAHLASVPACLAATSDVAKWSLSLLSSDRTMCPARLTALLVSHVRASFFRIIVYKAPRSQFRSSPPHAVHTSCGPFPSRLASISCKQRRLAARRSHLGCSPRPSSRPRPSSHMPPFSRTHMRNATPPWPYASR